MKKKDMIKVLKIEPGKIPYEKEIHNDLEGIQAEVEGLFECVYLDDNCIAVVNEEGKINGMELNRRMGMTLLPVLSLFAVTPKKENLYLLRMNR